MIVEQAIYGIKPGRGHGLVHSTVDERFLENVRTDFLSTINPHSDWKPYYKTQVTTDYFLFLKTFPDNQQERKGSVFTHVLMVKKSEIHLLENLNDVFSLFKNKEESSQSLSPIEIQPTKFQKKETSSVNKVVHYLVKPTYKNKPIVWLDKQDFLLMISELWSLIPNYTRQSFTFCYSVKPGDLTTDQYYILYSKQENHWDEYDTVKGEDIHQPTTAAERFVLNPKEENDISNFLTELDQKIYDFSKLQSIEKAADSYRSLSSLNFQKALQLLKRLTILAPIATQGIAIKVAVLNHLIAQIPKIEIDEIEGLGNLNISSLTEAKTKIQKAIEIRLRKELKNYSSILALVKLLKTFFQHFNKCHWWYKLIKKELASFFKLENQQRGQAVWHLWEEDILFVDWLKSYIPNTPSTEQLISTKTSSGLSNKLAESICNFAKERNWLLLHGNILALHTSTLEAFKLQLEIDKNPKHFCGLDVIAKKAKPNDIIESALNLDDNRLIVLAGKVCVNNSSLFNQINLENPKWQLIWLEASNISSIANIWNGFKTPLKTLYNILDVLIDKKIFNKYLLLKISQSNINNLLNYPNREKIWKVLHSDTKVNFLKSTAKAWYANLSIQNIYEELETDLLSEVCKIDFITSFIYSTPSFQLTLELFKRFKTLPEPLFCELINKRLGYKAIVSTEAVFLGELVWSKNWKKAQRIIINKFSKHNNLGFAIKKFESNLGFLDSAKLFLKGYSIKSMDVDEWWEQLASIMIKLYPNGINDNRIWERSGGSTEYFSIYNNSKEQWWDALKRLKDGGGGEKITVSKFLRIIKSDNPRNEQIKTLIETYRHFTR